MRGKKTCGYSKSRNIFFSHVLLDVCMNLNEKINGVLGWRKFILLTQFFYHSIMYVLVFCYIWGQILLSITCAIFFEPINLSYNLQIQRLRQRIINQFQFNFYVKIVPSFCLAIITHATYLFAKNILKFKIVVKQINAAAILYIDRENVTITHEIKTPSRLTLHTSNFRQE